MDLMPLMTVARVLTNAAMGTVEIVRALYYTFFPDKDTEIEVLRRENEALGRRLAVLQVEASESREEVNLDGRIRVNVEASSMTADEVRQRVETSLREALREERQQAFADLVVGRRDEPLLKAPPAPTWHDRLNGDDDLV